MDSVLKIVPKKTESEAILNKRYMPYIQSNERVPEYIVRQFLNDVAIIERQKTQLN